jgi:hypothetical protein
VMVLQAVPENTHFCLAGGKVVFEAAGLGPAFFNFPLRGFHSRS